LKDGLKGGWSGQPGPLVLWTLVGSHYCERAVWALEALGLAFERRDLAPGPHVFFLRRQAPQLPLTQLPVLYGAGHTVQGSDAILDFVGLPRGDTLAEAVLVDQIGPLVRRALYATLCGDAVQAREWVAQAYAPGPAWVRALATLAPAAWLSLLLRREGAQVADLPQWLATLETTCTALSSWASAELARRHDDAALSRAALSCGALLAPLMLPAPAPWHHVPWSLETLPRVQALQSLPLLQLAHAAWAQRLQTAPAAGPGQGVLA
jgi:glutathione S-transferase